MLIEPINRTTIHPAASIHKGYLYCFKIGIFLLAINIMANANGRMKPLISPAKSSNSFGLPIHINKIVDTRINPLIGQLHSLIHTQSR